MTDDNKPGKMPVDGPWLFQDALAHLGWDADPKELAEHVRRLDRGIPAEDEFAAVCAWLGNCTLLHKQDQVQVPASSKAHFQVPDLLARFTTQSTERPVLIEVKTSDAPQLRFAAGYMAKLKAYARMVGHPLLIAWKHHGIWTLFEAKHMEESKGNHYIDLALAMGQNLMGVLAGDVAFVMGDGAGVHLRMRKDEKVSEEKTEGQTNTIWQVTFDEVKYTSYTGESLTDVDDELQAIFMCAELEERNEESATHMWWSYVGSSETAQFGHRALVDLLHWETNDDGAPRWRHVIRRDSISLNMANLMQALQRGLELKVVRLVMTIQPHSMPGFVVDPTASGEE